jgi:hypothetical protein
MMRPRLVAAVAVVGLLAAAGPASADVKTTERSQTKFEGMLGRVMGLFGGKAMKEGVVNTVVVKGDRKVTATDESVTIVDLAEQKIYEVNIRDKSYRVITFAEMKKQIADAREKAEKEARRQETRDQTKDPSQKEMEIEFSAKDTGQTRQVSGFSCREVVLTVTMREKGKTLEEAGGIVMTADTWLAPRVPAMKEVQDFDLRYAQAMADALPSTESLAQAFAMYPGMKDAMVRMQRESVNMNGTPIETVATFQTVMTKEQAAQAKKDDSQSGGGSPGGAIGGMLGRFGRKKEEPKPAESAAAKPTSDSDTRTTLMTATSTLLSVATSVSADEVAVPAGFKLKK